MESTMKDLSPTLSAVMCDGMGSFSKNDYKRMLLTYDKIYYLLPEKCVEFEDINGKKQFLFFPIQFRENPICTLYHFSPKEKFNELIHTAAHTDLTNPYRNLETKKRNRERPPFRLGRFL